MLHGPYTLATPFVYQWKGGTGMKIAPLADVKARFSAVLLLAYSPKFQRILRAAKQQIRDGRGIKHQEIYFC
jgi:hypothetical protein